MNYTILGTCNLCGGCVAIPTIWLGTMPPQPRCLSCHAVMRSELPILPMYPLPDQRQREQEIWDLREKVRQACESTAEPQEPPKASFSEARQQVMRAVYAALYGGTP